MTSNAILNLIRRSHVNAIAVEVKEVFIRETGWEEPSSPNASVDDMKYLESINVQMVSFKVTNDDGSFNFPDYNIKSLINPKKYV